MRNLQTLLQLHLRCNHGIGVKVLDDIPALVIRTKVRHGKDQPLYIDIPDSGQPPAQRGSAVFHEIARQLHGVHGTREAMHITDDEYAAIVDGDL